MRFRSFFEWVILSVCLHLILLGAVIIFNAAQEQKKPQDVVVDLIIPDTAPVPTQAIREQLDCEVVP